jgi:hypothetical protein
LFNKEGTGEVKSCLQECLKWFFKPITWDCGHALFVGFIFPRFAGNAMLLDFSEEIIKPQD